MKKGRSKSILWGLITFLVVAALLITLCYPVWVVAIGGHCGLEAPTFTRIWRADFDRTVPFFLGVEVGIALLMGAIVFGLSEELNKPREVGI